MKVKVNWKWLIIVLVLAVIVFIVFHGKPMVTVTYSLHDNAEYTDITYKTISGDDSTFTCELKDSTKIVITYGSKDEFEAELTLTELFGGKKKLRCHIYEDFNADDSGTYMETDFEEIG